MFEDDLFAFLREQLTVEMAGEATPHPAPIDTDSWIARSIMQKAIRRGMTDLALAAAATLATTDPRVLWKRLIVTAMEDQGIGEVDYLARLLAAASQRAWRDDVGGDWRVIAHLITAACAGTRCQASNDLWNAAKNSPELDGFKTSLCDATVDDLLAMATDEGRPVVERGVAVLLVLGEDAGASAPVHITADPLALFGAFRHAGQFEHVAITFTEAFRLTRLALAPLSLCLWRASTTVDLVGADDDIPPTSWFGPVPAFSLDQYVRGGKTAIRAFVKSSPDWIAYSDHWSIRPSQQIAAAGELLFRAEGARVANRRQWEVGQSLYRQSEPHGCYVPAESVDEGLALIRRQLPLIDDLRGTTLTTNRTA